MTARCGSSPPTRWSGSGPESAAPTPSEPTGSSDGVVYVAWPGPPSPLPPGREGGPARLYLVQPGAEVPELADCFEDWVRLPATEEEITARTRALVQRLRGHRRDAGARPELDPVGVLHVGGRWADLPPMEARLLGRLLDRFGESVETADLLAAGWAGGRPGTGALRVHILRLRRRLSPLGLAIHTLPGRGYMLSWSEAPDRDGPAGGGRPGG